MWLVWIGLLALCFYNPIVGIALILFILLLNKIYY